MNTWQNTEIMNLVQKAHEIVIYEDNIKHVFTRNDVLDDFEHEEVLMLSYPTVGFCSSNMED